MPWSPGPGVPAGVWEVKVADAGLVVLSVGLFAVLAIVARAVEKL